MAGAAHQRRAGRRERRKVVMAPKAPDFPAKSGEGGIRTLERGLCPSNALAGRRLQPLGHFSVSAQSTGAAGALRYPVPARRGGRAVECGGLENRYGPLGPSRVQIPPPPLDYVWPLLAPVLCELLERLPVDCVAGDDRNAAWGCRPERRLAGAALQKRPLADECAGADLGHLLVVDLDGEHTVEEQVEHVTGLALLDERLAGRETLPLWGDASAHDLSRELPLEVALRRGHDRRRILFAPRSALAVRLAVPGLEVDRPGLLDELAAVVVNPVPRKGARADELVSGRAVRSNGEGERRPRRRAADPEERLPAHSPRRGEAGSTADRLHEAHRVRGGLRLGPNRLERDARE